MTTDDGATVIFAGSLEDALDDRVADLFERDRPGDVRFLAALLRELAGKYEEMAGEGEE